MTRHALGWIPIACDFGSGNELFELSEFGWAQRQQRASGVLLQISHAASTRDRDDPRSLVQKPRECELSGRHIALAGERLKAINEIDVRVEILFLPSRPAESPVALFERGG